MAKPWNKNPWIDEEVMEAVRRLKKLEEMVGIDDEHSEHFPEEGIAITLEAARRTGLKLGADGVPPDDYYLVCFKIAEERISDLRDRIDQLEAKLKGAGIPIPPQAEET